MRTNIVLDETLVEEARRLTGINENNYRLLHVDSDFDGFEQHLGLRVIHP